MNFIKNHNCDQRNFQSLSNKQNSKEYVSKKQILLLLFFGAIIGILNGFFGGGGGMVCVPILQKALNLTSKESHATAIAVIFPLSLVSASIYIYNGTVKSLPLITIGLGVVVGGIIGAYLLKFMPTKILRIVFAVIMLISGVRMII